MRLYSSGSVITSLMLMSSFLLLFFINKDNLIKQNGLKELYYHQYLENKFALLDKLELKRLNELCKKQKKEVGKVRLNKLNYYFSCHSLFVDLKENGRNYIFLKKLNKQFNLESVKEEIYYVNELSDFPDSNLSNPKVVIANKDIEGRLERDFYGIVITNYPFNIFGKRIYGIVYSGYNNGDRNLIYKKEVIENLQNRYWHYQPYSRNLLGDD